MSEKKKTAETSGVDVLDQIKSREKMVKANLLIKAVKELKAMARKINEIKVESEMTLEEIGLNPKDIKRVLDFINETSDVKLNEDDKKELRAKVKATKKRRKAQIEDKVEDKLETIVSTATNSTSGIPGIRPIRTGDPWYYYESINHSTCKDGEIENFTLTNDNGNLELKL